LAQAGSRIIQRAASQVTAVFSLIVVSHAGILGVCFQLIGSVFRFDVAVFDGN